jgi:hypothetical protein
VWCSEHEVLALEHELDILVLGRKHIINVPEPGIGGRDLDQ